MTLPLVHLVPGPEGHGVVRHALGVHPHLGEVELLRCDRLDALAEGAVAGRVVVVQVTDRVLAASPDRALDAWRRVMRGAARVTVVLHDLPQRSDGRHRTARSELYAGLAASADAVVVASRHERLLLEAALRWARPDVAGAVLGRTRVVPLPVEPDPGALPPPGEGAAPPAGEGAASPTLSVVTLGFVYPGKGLEEVVDAAGRAALDPRLAGRAVEVVNLGGASQGHEDLLEQLSARARGAGVSWRATGYVPDDQLPGLLAAATVPVAAHRHVSASGSIATWLAAGRRPVVVGSRYVRELAGRLPGTLHVVAPDELSVTLADALAVAAAPDRPESTWLGGDVRLGPSWQEAGRELAEQAREPAVSVVVPYYRDQELLDLLVRRLAAQTGVHGGLELVVADDGSPHPPVLPTAQGSLGRVRLRRQPDEGFRLAAARNLGIGATTGRVVVLLDGDTVPEDGYVAALQQVCLDGPTLAVGRRRHADLRGGAPWPPVDELPSPGWLADGYARTQDLRAADDASFRFVIGAVLGVSRAVLDAVGGFDGRITGYGGEDWEFAWRCWLAGARLRHVPGAVAWHDGPDVAGRTDATGAGLAGVKNAETARLAGLLPHPLVRGRGWAHPQPDVVVTLDVGGWTRGQVVLAVESVLRQGDVGVWLLDRVGGDLDVPDGDGSTRGEASLHEDALRDLPPDPRIHLGRAPTEVLARARAELRVGRPVWVRRLPWDPWPQHVDVTGPPGRRCTDDPASGVQVSVTRRRGLARLQGGHPAPRWLPASEVETVPPDVVVEHWRASHP
ncbi:glycosyltransferase [Serinicoccus sediminis]|uniref:glycosyltransferase n=1 Tax=Serinicoccus sediminis TaxID=2306021 RepID=UPI00101FA67F|nr:glycosyltransferase [Serinicoccus sediminis]